MFRPNDTAWSAMLEERPTCPHWCPAINMVRDLQEGTMGRNTARSASTLNESVLGAKESSVTNHKKCCRSIKDKTQELPLTKSSRTIALSNPK